jgi:lipoprotein signal peptidase|tara:strand:+ start:361 stop:609 length:249 start_codon:yes stop_codon:yes gene_type:complete
MIEKRVLANFFFWLIISLIIINYILSAYNSGHIIKLYREDMSNYALFSFTSIIALGFALGMLSEKITALLGLEIEKIEHFER